MMRIALPSNLQKKSEAVRRYRIGVFPDIEIDPNATKYIHEWYAEIIAYYRKAQDEFEEEVHADLSVMENGEDALAI